MLFSFEWYCHSYKKRVFVTSLPLERPKQSVAAMRDFQTQGMQTFEELRLRMQIFVAATNA